MIVRPLERAKSRPAAEMPGGQPSRVRSAWSVRWRRAFETAWKADGRDPAEIGRLTVVVP